MFKSLHSFERRIWACLGFRTDTKWHRTTSRAPAPQSRTLYVPLKMKVLVTQSRPTLCDPMNSSLPDSSVRGISQARILEWVAIPFYRDWTFLPTQRVNLGLLHCRQILFHLIHQRNPCFCWSVTQSCLTLWPHRLQHARLSCPSPPPRVCLNSCPLSWWCHPTISSSAIPFSSCFQSFQWVSCSHQVAKLKLQPQHQSLQWIFRIDFLWDWLIWSPCSPRDSQESSPTPQFKSINYLVLSLLYEHLVDTHEKMPLSANYILARWLLQSDLPASNFFITTC